MNNAAIEQATASPSQGGWSDLLRLCAGQGRLLGLTLVATVLAQFGMVASAASGAWLVGMAIGAGHEVDLTPGLWILAASVLLGAGGRWWQAHVSHDFAFALIETVQLGIYGGLARAAPASVLGHHTGELAGIALQDASKLEHFFAHTLCDAIAAFVVPLLALGALACVQPLLTLALLPFLPLLASVPFWLGQQAYRQGQEMANVASRLNAQVTEGVQGRKELLLFGRQAQWLASLSRGMHALSAAQRRYGVRVGLEQAAIEVLQVSALLCALLGGGFLVQSGQLPVALLPFVVVLVGAALVPLAEVAYTARQLGELRACAARILSIHQLPALVADGGKQEPLEASIQFEDVTYGYTGGRDRVLNGVDFSVKANEMVALVGRSGAGKSTCAHLLLRFWEPHSGVIRIGGVDLRDIPLHRLRQLVCVVPQEVYLFDESIEDNILLGQPTASQEQVREAARIAQAHDFIMELPQGYATRCGERGAQLSGGQRQRIAIARALLGNAPILILDEASSSLDAVSEKALQAALATLRHTRTLLMIAHRPSTIRQADRVIVLDAGRVAEQGSPATLIAR